MARGGAVALKVEPVEAYGLAEGQYHLFQRASGAAPVSLPPFPDLAFVPASLWP